MPVNLPSLTELGNAQFIDPMFYGQVQNQIGLGNQFAQQGLDKGAADLQQQVLANLFAEQNNPQRVEQQRLQNEGLGYDNQSKGVQARTDVELEGESKAAKRAKLLASASEDDLKRLQAQAEAELLNPDPQVQARAQKKLEGSWGEIQRRAKAADKLRETETIVGGRKSVAETNAAARETAALLSLEGNKYRADVQRALAAARGSGAGGGAMNLDKTLADAYRRAAEATDPDEKTALTAYAQGIQDIIVTQKQALAGTKPDLNQMGVPTLKLPGVAVPPTVKSTGPTNAGERAMKAAVADSLAVPNMAEEIRRQQALVDSGALSKEDKAVAEQYIAQLKQKQGQGKTAAPVKATKEGYTVIYKNGQPAQVPNANLEKALAQGYTLK